MSTTDNSSNSKEIINHTQRAIRSLCCGVSSGIVCTLTCAPLDITKTRIQVQGALGLQKYSTGLTASLSRIYTEEGISGLYKGVGPALVTVPLFWGVYWPLYDRLKHYYSENNPNLSPHATNLFSAVSAGAVGDVITNPFWVTRTRMQTLALHSNVNISQDISMFGMMRIIYSEEGFLAFYKGLGASILGLSHVAIQFPLCKLCTIEIYLLCSKWSHCFNLFSVLFQMNS